jgi:hypothetical protein
MKKLILVAVVMFSFCMHGLATSSDATLNTVYINVLQKLGDDTALLAYPCTQNEYGFWYYGKTYYVKDSILKNYADEDKFTGYKIEKV